MSFLAQHLVFRLIDDRVLASSTSERRILANKVLNTGRNYRLLAFRAADTHLHLLAACERKSAGELARRLGISLSSLYPVNLSPVRLNSITDQFHLANTFKYIMQQEKRHQLNCDPFHEASNLPDLLGLRLIGFYTVNNVRGLLPRIGQREILELFGADLNSPILSCDNLLEAAAAAGGLPNLEGSSKEIIAVRCAALQVIGNNFNLTNAKVGKLLGLSQRTVFRLRKQTVSPNLVRAVELQLRIRQNSGEGD